MNLWNVRSWQQNVLGRHRLWRCKYLGKCSYFYAPSVFKFTQNKNVITIRWWKKSPYNIGLWHTDTLRL